MNQNWINDMNNPMSPLSPMNPTSPLYPFKDDGGQNQKVYGFGLDWWQAVLLASSPVVMFFFVCFFLMYLGQVFRERENRKRRTTPHD